MEAETDTGTTLGFDPVCGKSTGNGTPFVHTEAGIRFSFCSAACRTRFMADPIPFMKMSGSRTPRGVRANPAQLLPDLEAWDEFATSAGMRGPAGTVAATPAPAPALPQREAPGGLMGLLLPMRERHFARRVSKEMLKLHDVVAQRHPELRGRALYRRIARTRLASDDARADAVVRQAEESFATWPSARALTYADVVHMIVIVEFRALHGGSSWIRGDLGSIIASTIPRDL